ncbi:Transcriptional regulator of nonfermentable carbon utilization [Puccinia graminis f. sp. tritici]|uniref:Transcriptional regulator of nonfermentable carbon utilization n=1 Tax=Puccinia graminis f. sp. tritici TaxID=56615 RepID=A0A5B0RWM2_PUCGR|nr:Transcriptional regulator of nonfermentable carbon utilization [Puccinia graminis f. sp. tritici]
MTPLEVEDFKKVKVATDDRDCRLSISWADLDLLENVGIPQYPQCRNFMLAGCETVGSANPTSQTWALGGLEEWLARFESGGQPKQFRRSRQLISLQENVKQADQTSERVDKECRKVGDEFCMLTEWSREDLVGKHIETVFEPESLEEYLDMVESSIFPDQESNHHPSRPRSQGSKTSSRNLPQRSSSSASSSSMTSSPSLSSIPLIALSQASDSNLSRGPYSNDRPDLTSSFAQSKTSNQSYGERECKETIKWFGIRKACGRESIGCSFVSKFEKIYSIVLQPSSETSYQF